MKPESRAPTWVGLGLGLLTLTLTLTVTLTLTITLTPTLADFEHNATDDLGNLTHAQVRVRLG